MSNIRNSHAHDMMNENIQHFAVSFDYKKEAGNTRRSGKAYTYKARKGEYKANDLAVVEVKNDYEDDMDNTPGLQNRSRLARNSPRRSELPGQLRLRVSCGED